MSNFRRGMAQPPAQHTPNARDVQPHRVVGRPVQGREPQPEPSRIVLPHNVDPNPGAFVRGVLVDGSGQMLRGLSRTTVQAQQAYAGTASEQCTRCGEMRTPAQMKTLIPNAESPNNPLRICDSCAQIAYKDPTNQQQEWRPSIPTVRFDPNEGRPYDARRAGVGLSDLLNRDTYHDEHNVDPEYRRDHVQGEGRWSGGARVGRIVR